MNSLRRWYLPGVCMLFLSLAIACERRGEETGMAAMADAAPAAVAAARERWVAGWNGDDPVVVTMAYVDDATATIDDMTYRGRAEIEGWVRDNAAVVSDLQLTPTSTQRVDGDWREDGTYMHLTTPPDVEPFMAEGRYSITWTADAVGDWRIRATDIQPNPPPEN